MADAGEHQYENDKTLERDHRLIIQGCRNLRALNTRRSRRSDQEPPENLTAHSDVVGLGDGFDYEIELRLC